MHFKEGRGTRGMNNCIVWCLTISIHYRSVYIITKSIILGSNTPTYDCVDSDTPWNLCLGMQVLYSNYPYLQISRPSP